MSDDDFMAEVERRYGEFPPEVRNDPGLLSLLLPCLRADVTAVETHEHRSEPTLECPISAFGGERDPWALPHEVEGWREQTAGSFRSQQFAGDHFFPETHQSDLLRAISTDLTPVQIGDGRGN